MQDVLRRASTLVAALAILGCTGDTPLEPVSVRNSTLRPSETPSVMATPIAPETPPAAADSAQTLRATPGGREGDRLLGRRSAREQSLGFRNEIASKDCLTEGASMGMWQLRFSGYGCVELTDGSSGTALSMQPMVATANEETHAPLLLGPEFGDRLMLTTRIETVQQLRQNGTPNSWEVAWLVWQYQDDEHFYYFIPKPNGWEVGKRDPAYPGGQRFLATGNDVNFPVGQVYNVQITQRGNVFSVSVDGVTLTSFADNERPYVAGRIALYAEDAKIRVHQVSVRTGAF